jgi:hypothetical protein
LSSHKFLNQLNRTEKKIALNKQISDVTEELSDKATGWKNLGKDALIIGGIAFAGYTLMRLFSGEEEENEVEAKVYQKEPDSVLFSAIKGAAASALLAVAKSKLTDYLENMSSNNE